MAFKFWLLCIAMFIVVIVERNCLLFLQHRRYKINLFLNFLKTVFDQITLKYAENFANCFVRFKSVANHVHVQWTRILNHPYSTRSSHRVRDLSVNFWMCGARTMSRMRKCIRARAASVIMIAVLIVRSLS